MTNHEATPATMSVDDCASALSVSRSSVYRYVGLGVIPSVRVGRRVVISRDYVEGLLEPLAPQTKELRT